MTTDQHQEILRTEGLSKFFPGVKALDNVDFSLRRGEIMALLGENGAGKSTLIKALTGVYHADRGTIWLEGQAISPKNTAHAQQLGIGTVYQEVNLLPNMSVADNLFIGREPKRFGFLRRKEMEKRATELMTSYGFSLDVREPLNRFSVAMQQIVAICRAIDLSAKVLILDEPTASLDTQEVELLFGLMRQLRDRGVSLIFVTHFLDQVYQVSDRITVLRNGSFVGCRETCELPQIELVKMMLGRELDTHELQRAGRTLLSDKPVAAFKNYGKKGTIAPFDLEVRPGEIVGLFGENGAVSDTAWMFLYEYLLIAYLRRWPDNRLAHLLQHRAAALGLGLGLPLLNTILRAVLETRGLTDGKAFQYMAYYRTALGALPNLLAALALFYLFKGLDLGCVRWVNALAGTTLGVYILHQVPAFRSFLWNGLLQAEAHHGSVGYTLLAILAVFLGCAAVDALRTALVMRPLENTRLFKALCEKGDALAAKITADD